MSLELARKLKKLGVRQESLSCWWLTSKEYGGNRIEFNHTPKNSNKYENTVSAFTVAELGEMLGTWTKNVFFDGHSWWIDVEKGCFNTEADARAKMLIYLLENNLVSLP